MLKNRLVFHIRLNVTSSRISSKLGGEECKGRRNKIEGYVDGGLISTRPLTFEKKKKEDIFKRYYRM